MSEKFPGQMNFDDMAEPAKPEVPEKPEPVKVAVEAEDVESEMLPNSEIPTVVKRIKNEHWTEKQIEQDERMIQKVVLDTFNNSVLHIEKDESIPLADYLLTHVNENSRAAELSEAARMLLSRIPDADQLASLSVALETIQLERLKVSLQLAALEEEIDHLYRRNDDNFSHTTQAEIHRKQIELNNKRTEYEAKRKGYLRIAAFARKVSKLLETATS